MCRYFPQYTNRVLSMELRHLDEFIEDLLFVRTCRGVITPRNRVDQFSPGCQAQMSPDSGTRHLEI
jgi:hypothetical protein